MILMPELVPEPLWGLSAYRLLGRGAKWKQIRSETLRAAGNRCSVCGEVRAALSCHEKWLYDDSTGTVTLSGFAVNCRECDLATHIGRAIQHGFADEAIEQLCRINNCSRKQADTMIDNALNKWRKRSSQSWMIVVDAALLRRYPALEVLHGKRGDAEPGVK